MRIRFLWIGETREESYRELEDAYFARISKLVSCEKQYVPELKKSDPRIVAAQQDREGKLIRKKLDKGTFLVVLDEKGEQFNSVQLADSLRTLMNRGVSSITFLIGGFMGIPESILDEADLRLSLSKLTFPHELARVVLLEQVYRSLSIINHLPYHR